MNPSRTACSIIALLLAITSITLAQVNIESPTAAQPATQPTPSLFTPIAPLSSPPQFAPPPQYTPSIVNPPVTAAPPQPTASTTPATLPSAQSVLQDLLREPPPHATTPTPNPTNPAASAARSTEPLKFPLREGQSIDLLSGHLAKDSATGQFLFIFDNHNSSPSTALPPMPVVPSYYRAILEDISEGGTKPVTVRIVATVTEYHGKNYLYITPGSDIPHFDTPESITPATAPATPTSPNALPHIAAVAPHPPETLRLKEGRSIIYNRTGRLIKDEKSGAPLFIFDSDGQPMHDPPMGLIPSRYLALLEDATKNATAPIKFRVSGEVTHYRGKNYLYLKFAQAVRDLHQGLGG